MVSMNRRNDDSKLEAVTESVVRDRLESAKVKFRVTQFVETFTAR